MNRIISQGRINGIAFERIVRDGEFFMPTKHFHDEFELYYLVEGSRYYFIDNQTYLVEAGSLVLINQHQIHKTSPSDNFYHDRILIEFHASSMAYLQELGVDFDLKAFFTKNEGIVKLRKNEQRYVQTFFDTVFHEFDQRQPYFQTQVKLKLSELLIYLTRILPTHPHHNPSHNQSPKQQRVNEISDYIASHYRETLSLVDLAEHFYMNKSYLSRVFKEITGFTVNEYIHITKIKKAKELLAHSTLSISEIADGLGYTSLTYFERLFKKLAETTPTRYRKYALISENPLRDRLNNGV